MAKQERSWNRSPGALRTNEPGLNPSSTGPNLLESLGSRISESRLLQPAFKDSALVISRPTEPGPPGAVGLGEVAPSGRDQERESGTGVRGARVPWLWRAASLVESPC